MDQVWSASEARRSRSGFGLGNRRRNQITHGLLHCVASILSSIFPLEMGKPGAGGGESCFDHREVCMRCPSGIIRRQLERYLILLYLDWSVGFWPGPALA